MYMALFRDHISDLQKVDFVIITCGCSHISDVLRIAFVIKKFGYAHISGHFIFLVELTYHFDFLCQLTRPISMYTVLLYDHKSGHNGIDFVYTACGYAHNSDTST